MYHSNICNVSTMSITHYTKWPNSDLRRDRCKLGKELNASIGTDTSLGWRGGSVFPPWRGYFSLIYTVSPRTVVWIKWEWVFCLQSPPYTGNPLILPFHLTDGARLLGLIGASRAVLCLCWKLQYFTKRFKGWKGSRASGRPWEKVWFLWGTPLRALLKAFKSTRPLTRSLWSPTVASIVCLSAQQSFTHLKQHW